MAEVVLFHHVQGLTEGVRAFAEAAARGRAHRAHAGPVRRRDAGDHRRRHGPDPVDRSTRCWVRRANRRWPTCPTAWSTPASRSVPARRSGWPRPGPERAAPCCSSRASRSPATGRSGRGPTGSRCRSTAWTRTRSSHWKATSTPPASWSNGGPRTGELFVYPGDQHLFTDSSLPSYDADATALVVQRSRDFLDRLS